MQVNEDGKYQIRNSLKNAINELKQRYFYAVCKIFMANKFNNELGCNSMKGCIGLKNSRKSLAAELLSLVRTKQELDWII